MSDKELVATIYGKYNKYEIVKTSPIFGDPEFYIRKNGKPHRGAYASLQAAVRAAEEED